MPATDDVSRPYPQIIAPRVAEAHRRLSSMIWSPAPGTASVRAAEPSHAHVGTAEGATLAMTPVAPGDLPLTWGRKFQQRWWRLTLDAPADGSTYLDWRDHAEATLYAPSGEGDWLPCFGFDAGHDHAPVPAGATELLVESACQNSAIWVPGARLGLGDGGSVFRGAHLARRDDAAWSAWHDLDVLIDLCRLLHRQTDPQYQPRVHGGGGDPFEPVGFRPPIESAHPLLRLLIAGLGDAVDTLDRRGVAAMADATGDLIRRFPASSWAPAATLTGHAHIDLIWKWPERTGEAKAVHSFGNALDLLRRYPEFRFAYSQPASYEAVARRSPATDAAVRAAIDAGRWEAAGAMYVESDTDLPCGEALLRSVELGRDGVVALGGDAPRYVWLPDVFGYSGALPTILAGYGVTGVFTTKLHWSRWTKFPHSAFRWAGNDGSEVSTFVAHQHYNMEATVPQMDHAMRDHRQVAAFGDALVPTGFGDGGGGPTATMCERARRLADLAEMPRARWGRVDDYMDRLHAVREALPPWRGEIYVEGHKGTLTTHGALKSAYRAAERGLQTWEATRCCIAGGPIDVQPWKRVAFAQFHDSITGTSIQEVYEELVPELDAIASDTLARAAADLSAAGGRDAGPCLFNALPMPRRVEHDGRLIDLPPLAGVSLTGVPSIPVTPPRRDGLTLANDRVSVTFDTDGTVAAMTVDGEPLDLRPDFGALVSAPDHPPAHDAWDVEANTLNALAGSVASRGEVPAGDGRVAFAFETPGGSTIIARYALSPTTPVLMVDWEVDWREPQRVLRATFRTGYAGRSARYGVAFGSCLRPQHANTLADAAQYENPASRWAVATGDAGRRGLSLVTESKYGVGCRDGTLSLTLVRSPRYTDADDERPLRDLAPFSRDPHPCDQHPEWEDHTDLHLHRIRAAVGPFRPDAPRGEQPAALADLLFTPPIAYTGVPADAGLLGIDGGPSLVPAWARPLDGANGGGAWLLRLHETLGASGTATLRLRDGLTATDCRADGTPTGEPRRAATHAINFVPYGLHTVCIAP